MMGHTSFEVFQILLLCNGTSAWQQILMVLGVWPMALIATQRYFESGGGAWGGGVTKECSKFTVQPVQKPEYIV